MKKVKLKGSFLVGEKFRNDGDVLTLSDVQAERLIAAGHAEPVDFDTDSTDEADNPLADSIDPLPPTVQVINPADALAPKIADNPGLVDLVRATGKQGEVPHSGTAAGMKPHPTGEDEGEKLQAAGEDEGEKLQTATKKAGNRQASNLTGKAE